METIYDILFSVYAGGGFEPMGAEPLMYEGTQVPDQKLADMEESLHMPYEQAAELEGFLADEIEITEKKAFLNGLRIGAALLNFLQSNAKIDYMEEA